MSKITILRSTVSEGPAGKNYKICELAYKTEEGKTKGMKMLSFLNKDAYGVASTAKPGDVLDASFNQSEKGFWQFSSLKSTGETGSVAKDTGDKVSPRSGTWETPEERAEKQAKISKQAVLNTSVAFFEAAKVKPSKEDVVEVAKYFLEFVNNKVTVTGDVA